ncbi:hypothetical protein XM38_047960 [Halomicronema hongdechloris C2206]|uniref:Uncharacterized protein n=1 Tax=Halomicronema hongdechloris C2206 TaxID=1641165 RepID=A0A1Z3HU56_9CYAN|nr:hypothetical protein [Halomicronema hongdechloris]ASC73823.1 hypothetical protein XM38_047960 [Halomicronema hongdechloris C2206]
MTLPPQSILIGGLIGALIGFLLGLILGPLLRQRRIHQPTKPCASASNT